MMWQKEYPGIIKSLRNPGAALRTEPKCFPDASMHFLDGLVEKTFSPRDLKKFLPPVWKNVEKAEKTRQAPKGVGIFLQEWEVSFLGWPY
ncbi:MAG: hypothetical protein ACM3KE_06840 [Hyphomicrobiales bacterium]